MTGTGFTTAGDALLDQQLGTMPTQELFNASHPPPPAAPVEAPPRQDQRKAPLDESHGAIMKEQ
jgi:hypothetical protein